MLTIADKVRYMNDDQLAKFMMNFMVSGCLLVMKFPGTDRKWLDDHTDNFERIILKFLREDESARDWSWLNGHKRADQRADGERGQSCAGMDN